MTASTEEVDGCILKCRRGRNLGNVVNLEGLAERQVSTAKVLLGCEKKNTPGELRKVTRPSLFGFKVGSRLKYLPLLLIINVVELAKSLLPVALVHYNLQSNVSINL